MTLFYWVMIMLGLSFNYVLLASESALHHVSYSIISSCQDESNKRAARENEYFMTIEINSLVADYEDFQIYWDGRVIGQFHVDGVSLPFKRSMGPFEYTSVGGGYSEFIIQSLNMGASDTMYIREVACGLVTNNGLNRAGYTCNRGNISVMAQTAPEEVIGPMIPEKTYVFILMRGGLVVAKNFSGRFDGVDDLQDYEIHAFASSFETSAAFLSSIIVGEALDQRNLDVCYGLCGIYRVKTDCSSFALALEKLVNGSFVVRLGDTIRFDIIVRNIGSIPGYDIVVQDTPPSELTFLSSISPMWNQDYSSVAIPELLPGSAIVLPMFFKVTGQNETGIVVNAAQLEFATDIKGKSDPAFNSANPLVNGGIFEADRDSAQILILDSWCRVNFNFYISRNTLCAGGSVSVTPMINNASPPLEYYWRFNNQFISSDSFLFIANPQSKHFGSYSLTIVDSIGCSATRQFNIEPINNADIIACYSDVTIGIDESCRIDITPDMITRAYFSGREDYLVETRSPSGELIDPTKLASYGELEYIEARLVNPCNKAIKCWTRVKLVYDNLPIYNHYTDSLFTNCNYDLSADATSILDQFNRENFDTILSAAEYELKLNQQSCIRSWDVVTRDVFLRDTDMCRDNVVGRIYSVEQRNGLMPIDTVLLRIGSIGTQDLMFPSDVENAFCNGDISPTALSSFPLLLYRGDTISLMDKRFSGDGDYYCSMGIKYSDQYYTSQCLSGTAKVVRSWTALDWCTNQVKHAIQYIYTRDMMPPLTVINADTIRIQASNDNCRGTIDVREFIEATDDCDPSPRIEILSAMPVAGSTVFDLEIGYHSLTIKAIDQCGNYVLDTIMVHVIDDKPPVGILKEILTVTVSSSDVFPILIPIEVFDSGSHDGECGSVELSIVRKYEYGQLLPLGRSLADVFLTCIEPLTLDINGDNLLTIDELFQPYLSICCRDIGHIIPVIIRIQDVQGNLTELEAKLEVTTKEQIVSCDDGNPCTVNDVMVGNCPCAGQYVYEDLDADGIEDCGQETMEVCLAGVTIEVKAAELNDYIMQGGTLGKCVTLEEMAMVGGEIYTLAGAMLPNVTVTEKRVGVQVTNQDGKYAFEELPMYLRYELTPRKDDYPLNGVTALDLVIIQNHILGIELITDPYILIAADVNADGKISILDILELRRMLLGLQTGFSANNSWRFVLEDFDFDDIRNPFTWYETSVISSLERDHYNENWIAIKIGDVSGNASASSLEASGRKSSRAKLMTTDRAYRNGEVFTFNLSIPEIKPVLGAQYRISCKDMEILTIESSTVSLNKGEYHFSNQYDGAAISLVWYDEKLQTTEPIEVTVRAKAKRNLNLAEALKLDVKYNSVVYDVRRNQYALELGFKSSQIDISEAALKLFQNQPNPFNGYTLIQFEVPEEGEVELSIVDAIGRRVYYEKAIYGKGLNAVNISRSNLGNVTGMLYYTVKYKNTILTKSMVNSYDSNR